MSHRLDCSRQSAQKPTWFAAAVEAAAIRLRCVANSSAPDAQPAFKFLKTNLQGITHHQVALRVKGKAQRSTGAQVSNGLRV
jgi:hypothetical protein